MYDNATKSLFVQLERILQSKNPLKRDGWVTKTVGSNVVWVRVLILGLFAVRALSASVVFHFFPDLVYPPRLQHGATEVKLTRVDFPPE